MIDFIREIRSHVRILVTGAATVAVLVFAVLAFRTPAEASPAWVATADGKMGDSLTSVRPQVIMLPPAAIPASAIDDLEKNANAKLAVPLQAGTVLTESILAGSEFGRQLGPNEAAVPLVVPRSVAQGLNNGDNIDLWGKSPDCIEVTCQLELLAESAEILEVNRIDASDWGEPEQTRVMLVLERASVGSVLSSSTDSSLHFVMRQPKYD